MDFSSAEDFSIKPIFEMYGILLTKDNYNLYSEINLSCWKKYEKGIISKDECVHNRWDMFFHKFGIKVDGSKVNDLYFNRLKNSTFLIPNAINFLKIASSKYRICIITNGVKSVQESRLSQSDILKYIDKVYISEEIGYNKPDKRFFEYVLDDLNVNNKECIVIGDSISSDIEGAINSNIDYILFDKDNRNDGFKGNRVCKLMDLFKHI